MAKKKLKPNQSNKISVFFKLNAKEKTVFSRFNKIAHIPLEALSDEFFDDREHSVDITFCSDAYIQSINKEFRKKDKPTDVLSFPTDFLNDKYATTLGDILISISTAKRQAKENKHTLLEEITKLYIHGLLHLLGFDHEKVSQRERQTMKRWEKKLYSLCGLSS